MKNKPLIETIFAVLFMLLAVFLIVGSHGCAQHYDGPTCADAVINPDPSCAFTPEKPTYQTISLSVMHFTLTDTLGVPAMTSDDPVDDPLHYPDAYLQANASALGEPDYEAGIPAGPMTSGGFKAWLLASSSACGIAMTNTPERLFPNGNHDYTYAYALLLGRKPKFEEAMILTTLQGQFPDPVRGEAAVCTSILNSLEFMDANL